MWARMRREEGKIRNQEFGVGHIIRDAHCMDKRDVQ